MARREFHFEDGKSAKFWAIELTGSEHTVQFGRIGTTGQTKTKAFDSEAEASASCAKLIASKVKKGYVEQGAPATSTETPSNSASPTPPDSLPNSECASSGPLPAGGVTPAPAPHPHAPLAGGGLGDRPPESHAVLPDLGLPDWAWHLAPWRRLPPLERGTPRAFKRDKALKRLRKLQGAFQNGYRGIDWEKEVAPALTREEAAFWLRVGIMLDDRSPPETVADAIEDDPNDLATFEPVWPRKVAADLALRVLPHLLSTDQVLDLIIGRLEHLGIWSKEPTHHRRTEIHLCTAFGQALFPFLTVADREGLAKRVEAALDPSAWPALANSAPRAWYLAGQLGLADPIRALVRSWPDGRFDQLESHYQHPVLVLAGLGDADEVLSEARRLKLHTSGVFELQVWLAVTGTAGLAWAAAGLLDQPSYWVEEPVKVLLAGSEPDLASAALTLATKGTKRATKMADTWIAKHPLAATRGLLREVSTGSGKRVEAAWGRLRDLAALDVGATLRSALELESISDAAQARLETGILSVSSAEALKESELPPAVRAALDAVKGLDKPPKAATPEWLSPRSIRVPTIGGAPLDPDATGHVLRALFEAPVNGAAAGPGLTLLRALRQACDPERLEAFAWDLYELWERRGTPPKQKWVMHALGHLGGPETVARLTPLVRAWPGQSQHARAVLGLECLRTIGTDLALSAIAGIAAKLKYRALKQRAGDLMQDIASDRGLSTEALADRLVPDCGLDANGQRTFDYGGRTFRFCLGPELNPMVQNEAGKLLKAPPKPGKKDDPEKAPAALKEWRAFRKLVKGTLALQVERLERAMVSGRRWSLEEFETFLVGHPLLRSVIIMVVWADHGAAPAATFRVTEAGARLDVAGKPLEVEGPVGLLHPLALAPDARTRWQQVLDEEELLAPFPQLEREVFEATEAERGGRALERGAGLPIGQTALRGLLAKQGWTRGEPQDAGVVHEHIKVFEAAGVTAVLQHGGISVDGYEFADASPVERVLFLPGRLPIEECVWTPPAQGLAISAVDPVVLSEVLRDLDALATKAQS